MPRAEGYDGGLHTRVLEAEAGDSLGTGSLDASLEGTRDSVPVAFALDHRDEQQQQEQQQPQVGADAADTTSVWAESVRLAVEAQPAALCTSWLAAACLLQLAFVASLVGALSSRGDDALGDEATRNNWFTAVAIVAFLMMAEVCASPSAAFLRHKLGDASAYQHVEGVRKAGPSVRWHMQCYHYRTESHTSQMDGTGNKQATTTSRQVRHNTHSAWATYTPYYWEDISSPFPDIGSGSLTRLTFQREFVFADDESRSHFRSAKRQFIEANQRDCHYEFAEHLETPGFQRHVLACKDSRALPWWLSKWAYYLCSLFCLTVPYRLAFAKMCWEIPEYRCERAQRLPPTLSATSYTVANGCLLIRVCGRVLWCRYQAFLLPPNCGHSEPGPGPHHVHNRHASGAGRGDG
eukprot:COSAG06_NODE_23_length_33072_cov_44.622327_31_plen_407_part_00